MIKTLHAVFDGKVLKPEESVDLEQDVRYLVIIEQKDAIIDKSSLWDILDEFSGIVEGPEDWSEEHDHYLYGTPKQEKPRK